LCHHGADPASASATASATVVAVPMVKQSTPASGGMPKVKLSTGTRSSTTTASWSSNRNAGRGTVGTGTPLSSAQPATPRSDGGGSGANKLTANGFAVSERTAAISARNTSGGSAAPAIDPRPPASQTWATSIGVVQPPAIGACRIGSLMPSRLASAVSRQFMGYPLICQPCQDSMTIQPFTLGIPPNRGDIG
jgi:hypothetical protein